MRAWHVQRSGKTADTASGRDAADLGRKTLAGYETLQVTSEAGVGHIRLTEPARRNAVSATMLVELARAARELDETPSVDVVVLDGAGEAFCAGADVDNFDAFLGRRDDGGTDLSLSAQRAAALARLGRAAVDALEGMRATTVARVHGYAIGAGVLLAGAADFRVLAGDAYLHIPEIDIGTPLLWGGIPRLVRQIGPTRTLDLVMTCRRISAEEALAIGWATRVVPADRLDEEVEQLVASLLSKPAFGMRATKEHVLAVSRAMSVGDTSYADAYLAAACWVDPQARATGDAYVQAFRTGRSAPDRGEPDRRPPGSSAGHLPDDRE